MNDELNNWEHMPLVEGGQGRSGDELFRPAFYVFWIFVALAVVIGVSVL